MKMDTLNWRLLAAVQEDGRQSLKSLAEVVGLSVPATSERLKRLEEAGIIESYRAVVNPEALGIGVMAIVGITALRPRKAALIESLEAMPEVLECLHVTGDTSYLLRVVTEDLAALESFVGRINHFGETRTSIVMSHPIRLRGVAMAKHESGTAGQRP